MKSDIIVSKVTSLRESTEVSREKQELLNEVVASTSSRLTAPQRDKLFQLLWHSGDVFAVNK